MRSIKHIPLFTLLFILCTLAAAPHSAQAGDIAAAKSRVISAYKSYKRTVDVSACDLYNTTDSAAINNMMTEVVNETPGLFYAQRAFAKLYDEDTGKIASLELGYLPYFTGAGDTVRVSRIKSVKKKLSAKVNSIVKMTDSRMTKLEKALFVHDYLIANTRYKDSENDKYCMSEWGVLLKGRGNCQGYSLTYGIIMKKLGIPVRYVSSKDMGHMWNLIKLGGSWYHVDVTWDDPIDAKYKKDQYGVVFHEAFLCSSSMMQRLGYYGFSTVSTASRYDNAFWRAIKSRIYRTGSRWIYQSGNAIYTKAKMGPGQGTRKKAVGGNCFIKKTDSLYYFLNYNRIYLYNLSNNSVRLVGSNTDLYGKKVNIVQQKYSKGYIILRADTNGKLKKKRIRTYKGGLLDK